MNRQVRTPWTISSWPTMTLEISDFTWLYRVRNSRARASIDSEDARDIDGDPFVTVGDVLELDGFPRSEPEFRPPQADALSCRGSRPGPRIALVLFFVAVFPDPLLGFEQAVGVAGVLRPRRVGGEAGAGARRCSCRGSGPRPLPGLTALEQRFANGGDGSPRSRIGGRRRLEPGREAGPVELLPDLSLASAQLVEIVTAAHDLLTSQSVPSVGHRELDPVHVRGDPPNRDIAQEQAGRQPEQGRPERRERPGIDQAGITAEMVDSAEHPGQVDPAIARGLPGHDLAFGEAGQGLERGRVGSKLSVLVGVRYGNASGDHALGLVRASITQVHEVVAAGLGVLDGPLVPSRRGLDELDGRGLEVRVNDVPLDLEEVEELVLLVERIDDNLDSPLFTTDRKRQVAALGGTHRPPHDLRPERGIALPVGPGLGPAATGVGGEGDRPA